MRFDQAVPAPGKADTIGAPTRDPPSAVGLPAKTWPSNQAPKWVVGGCPLEGDVANLTLTSCGNSSGIMFF